MGANHRSAMVVQQDWIEFVEESLGLRSLMKKPHGLPMLMMCGMLPNGIKEFSWSDLMGLELSLP